MPPIGIAEPEHGISQMAAALDEAQSHLYTREGYGEVLAQLKRFNALIVEAGGTELVIPNTCPSSTMPAHVRLQPLINQGREQLMSIIAEQNLFPAPSEQPQLA